MMKQIETLKLKKKAGERFQRWGEGSLNRGGEVLTRVKEDCFSWDFIGGDRTACFNSLSDQAAC